MVSVRTFLLSFALAIALPIAVFFILLGWSLSQSDLKQAERRTWREANSIAVATRFVLNDMKSTMQLLASAPDLVDGKFEEFHKRARTALAGSGHFAIVVDATGQQLLNTRVQYGRTLGKTANMDAFRRAVQTRNLTVSNVFFGITGSKWVFNIVLPIPKREGLTARALIITKDADELRSAFPDSRPAYWQAAIVDSDGKIVVSTAPSRFQQGKKISNLPDIFKLEGQGNSEPAHTVMAGEDNLIAASEIDGAPWRAIVWGPVASVQPSLLKNWRTVLIMGGILLGISLIAGLFVADYLRRSIDQLANMANVTGRGEVPEPISSPIAELNDVGTALATAAHQRNLAEEHFRVAAQEIAHRTKNLIAVVTAIVRQTIRHAESPEEISSSLVARIAALGRSIDLLLSSGNQADLRTLLENEIVTLGVAENRIEMQGPAVNLKPEAAQALAMAFYELATNAVKYGALSTETGHITVGWELREEDGEHQFYVFWIERGGPESAKMDRSGFGSRLMTTHLETVVGGKATLSVAPEGLEWSLRTPGENVVAPQRPPQGLGATKVVGGAPVKSSPSSIS